MNNKNINEEDSIDVDTINDLKKMNLFLKKYI